MCYNLMKEEILIRLREMKADIIDRLQVMTIFFIILFHSSL